MPNLGKPALNWKASCLDQKYIRWHNIVQDKLAVHKTKEAHKENYIRVWIGDKGTQYLMKLEWKDNGKITNQ